MSQKIQPYLFFDGRCEEALEFYRATLGMKVTMMMRFNESPEPCDPGMVPPGWEKKIMHAELQVGDSILMASDGCGGRAAFEGFSLSFSVANEAEAHRIFSALAEGGKVVMPLTKTFYSPCFGMVQDRFGVGWMVIVPA